MTKIDQILWFLLDGNWHTLKNVAEALQIDIRQLEKIITFLAEFNFIQYNAPRIRITTETKKFLEKTMRAQNQTEKNFLQN